MNFKIASYNVNGLRARIKHGHLQAFLDSFPDIDILCLQETKAEEAQVKLPPAIASRFPHRCWQSTRGTTQRKGLSGTAIWASKPFTHILDPFDEEGRLTAVEFEHVTIASVYTPTTGSHKNRYIYRVLEWDRHFAAFLRGETCNPDKPLIVCGDLNVCHQDQDVYDAPGLRNKIAGFLDIERLQFCQYLDQGYLDAFRHVNPKQAKAFTWWNPRQKIMYDQDLGLRLDYFLLGDQGKPFTIHSCEHLVDVRGSDHCPILLDVTVKPKS